MSRTRISRTIVLALASLVALPAVVLAASAIDLGGTVTRDAAPVEGVSVTAWLVGDDIIVAATTDANGAFAVQLEGDAGGVIQVRATGQTVTFEPDDQGCVRSETPTGRAEITIEALPVPPVAISLDTLVVSNVCGTAATARPAVTLPPTDANQPGSDTRGVSTLALVGLLGLMILVMAAIGRPAHRRG